MKLDERLDRLEANLEKRLDAVDAKLDRALETLASHKTEIAWVKSQIKWVYTALVGVGVAVAKQFIGMP